MVRAVQLARSIQEAEAAAAGSDTGDNRDNRDKASIIGPELRTAVEAVLRVKDETMLLNNKVAEATVRQEAADKAGFYLEGMQGAEHVMSEHCEFVAQSVACCRLPEGPGTWSQGKTLKLLLLRGTRRQLLFYNEALGVSGTTRTCVLKVDMSSVISISEPHTDDTPTPDPSRSSRALPHAGGSSETFTMTLKLGSNSTPNDLSKLGAVCSSVVPSLSLSAASSSSFVSAVPASSCP